jgi:hypothetical protein
MTALLGRIPKKSRALDKTLQIVMVSAAIVTICAFLFDFQKREAVAGSSANEFSSDTSLDTFIPDGFSLIPIEIINSNGMDSILGRYGTADLFQEGHKSAFMRNVRLVRGIREDGPWAALVPSEYATSLLEAGGRFFVAVKSKKVRETEYRPKVTRAKRTIFYEGD